MRRRRSSAIGLAGWLFADLSLVLAFIFLNSETSGTGDSGEVSSSSTTIPISESVKGGADPEPLEIVVRFSMDMSSQDLIRQMEAALSGIERGDEARRPFLVVLSSGSSRNESNAYGRQLARRAQDLLRDSWQRVVNGRTYYVPVADEFLEVGTVQFKLFPVSNVE